MDIKELNELIRKDEPSNYCYQRFKAKVRCPYCNKEADALVYNVYSQFMYWYVHKDGKVC